MTAKFLRFFEENCVGVSLWNNGLREAVVTDAFLFLSTFFIQSAIHILVFNLHIVNTFVFNF